MRLVPALLCLMLATAACGPGQTDVAGGSTPTPAAGDPASTPATPGTSGSAGTGKTPGSGGANAPGGAASAPPGSRVAPGPGKRNTMPLRVTLNRTCAEHGDELVSEAVTVAGAQITFAAGYTSSNDLPPDFEYVPKEANLTGKHTWRWVVRPDIKPGDAILSVVASKDGKGASYNIPFRIAKSC